MPDVDVKKVSDLLNYWHTGDFKAADNKSESQIIVNKMADPIWQT